MIVLDASVVVELLTNEELAETIRHELATLDEEIVVPHLLDIEVMSALRRLAAGQRIEEHRCEQAIDALRTLPAVRYSHEPLLGRIWELRRNFTAYDAVYIALAEAMDATLYTCDEKLRRGHRATVELFTY